MKQLSVRRACQVVGVGRATYYRPVVDWAQRDAPVIEALTTLRETNVLDDETVATLEKSIADFKLVFRTSSGQSLAEQFTALDEAEIQQEQLVVKK